MNNKYCLSDFIYFNLHSHKLFQNENSKFTINSYDIHELQNFNPESPYTIGFHPWYLNNNSFKLIEKLEEYTKNPLCYGVGEAGLDKLKGSTIDIQEVFFKLQIDLSNRISKPLILHIVKAYSELDFYIKKYFRDVPWIIHGFYSSVDIAENLINKGLYLSFSYKAINSGKYTYLFQKYSPEFYFFETDDDSCDIEILYQTFSSLYGYSLEDTSNGQKKLYNLIFKDKFRI